MKLFLLDREKKIAQFKKDLSLLKDAQVKLTKEEEDLRSQYEKVMLVLFHVTLNPLKFYSLKLETSPTYKIS